MAEEDTERTAVKTYVPAYQKNYWKEHADRLDMSLSEFVRTMVQAGRSEISAEDNTPEKRPSPDANPGVRTLETQVRGILRERGYCSWDELLANLSENLESRLDETLADLQSENAVRYSGRQGGYTLIDDE